MGLNLSRAGIVHEKDLEARRNRTEKLLEEVNNELAHRGIPEVPRPSGHPKALAEVDITTLTNDELTTLYAQYAAYSSYIGDQLAQIEAAEEDAKRNLRETIAEIKDALFAKSMKGPEATAAAMKDPMVEELSLLHMKYFFMKAIMKRRYKSYVTQGAALSRSIELRKLDMEQTRRTGNLGRRPSLPTPGGFGTKQPSAGKVPQGR
jgi:hypothetical protein